MKPILRLALLFLLPLPLSAQFIYSPLPLKAADFTAVRQAKYTRCLVYTLQGEDTVLAKAVEYGNTGLVAALYEKGTNDNGDSVITATTHYKFNGKGQLVTTDVDDAEFGESRSAIVYDATGKAIRKMVATIDPPTYTYQYDAKGKLLRVNVSQRFPALNAEGEFTGKGMDKPTYRYTYRHNAKGQLAEETEYRMTDGKWTPAYRFAWTYDDKGRVIAVRRLDSDGSFMNGATYAYDAEGLLSRSVEKDAFAASEVVYIYAYNRDRQSWMQ